MAAEEYKEAVNMDNENSMTVQFGDWSTSDLFGFSTFPWEKEIYSNQGGVLLKVDCFGVSGHYNNLIHETGHVLGLWHVHHGVNEVPCDDPCQEKEPSMVTGQYLKDNQMNTDRLFVAARLCLRKLKTAARTISKNSSRTNPNFPAILLIKY